MGSCGRGRSGPSSQKPSYLMRGRKTRGLLDFWGVTTTFAPLGGNDPRFYAPRSIADARVVLRWKNGSATSTTLRMSDPRFYEPRNGRERGSFFARKTTLPLLPLYPRNTTKVRIISMRNVRDCNRSPARYNALQHNRFCAVRQARLDRLRNRGLGVRVPPGVL